MKRCLTITLAAALLVVTISAAAPPAVPTGLYAIGDVRVLFLGDIMMGRQVNQLMAGNFEKPFKNVTSFLQSPDLTVANLEGPLVPTSQIPRQVPNSFNLTGDTRAAAMLAKMGFDVLSVANNHAFDAGANGLMSTIASVRSAGIGAIGVDNAGKQDLVVKEVRGLKIAFLAYADFLNIPGTGVTYIRVNVAADRARVTNEIAAAKKVADIVVVFWHWGTEYTVQPNAAQKQMAQLSADAGADLVIGSHPHVAQGMELKSKLGRSSVVVYSLGNALFDQYFSQEVRQGLALEARVDRNGVKSARFIALENRRDSTGYTMNVADDAVGQFAIQRATRSTSPDLQWKVLWGQGQAQPGLAIAYRRPESTTGRSSLERLGMPDPSRVELYSNRLTVSKYVGSGGSSQNSTNTVPRTQQVDWLPVWSSDPGWRVTSYAAGDVDGDGQQELIYTLWKRQLVWQRTQEGGISVSMQGGDVLPHIYINGWRRGQMAPVWHGSPRPMPVLAVAIAPLGKNGKPAMAVLESGDKNTEKGPGKISLWQWGGNFGFELASSVNGTYSQMWGDGKVLMFK